MPAASTWTIRIAGAAKRHPVPLVVVQIVLMLLGEAGKILFSGLVKHHPLTLILLNVQTPTLIAVSTALPAAEYFTIGAIRMGLVAPCAYLLGRHHTATFTQRLLRRPKFAHSVATPTPGTRAAVLATLIVSLSTPVAFAAGATGVRARSAAAAAAAGIALRLTLAREFAATHRVQVDTAIDFVDRWALPIAAAIAVGILLSALRRGNRSPHDQDHDHDP